MHMQESAEMYLETIYILSQASSTVRNIDIAEHMGYSKPSVTRGVGLLKQRGLVETDKDGHLALTAEGLETAREIYERHTVLSQLLMKLGVDAETAAEDACRIEHVISDAAFGCIKKYLEG